MFSFFYIKKISTFKDLKSKREGKQIIRRKSFNAAVRFRFSRASQVALVVKNLPANAGDIIDVVPSLGQGRSPGRGQGNSLKYSCLGSLKDMGAWQAIVHGVAKSQMKL